MCSARPAGDDGLARRVGDAEVTRGGFDDLPVPVILLDGPEHRVVGMNAAYRAFSGRHEVIGQTIREAFPEIETQQLFELIEQVFTSAEPVHAREWRIEFDPGDGAPQTFYLDFEVLPRRHEDGTVHGILIQQVDVTERVRQRQQAEAVAAEAEERYRLAREVVLELQRALLPTGLPILPRIDVSARYLVAGAEQSAGGDWFDVRVLSGNRVGLVVGDVVGHGVTAAAVMSQLRAVLADAVVTTEDPSAAVQRLERFAATVPGAQAATVVVAVLDPAAGTMDYVTRGHPPPLLVDAAGRGRYLLASGGGPLGSDLGGPAQRTTLAVDDTVVLFSDGLVERPDQSYATGLDQLTRLAEGAVAGQLWPTGDTASAVTRICTDAVELLTQRGYDDDVTVLAAAVQLPIEPLDVRVHTTDDGVSELRERLRAWLSELNVEPVEQLSLEMAVGEAVDNAVEHGLDRRIDGTVALHLDITGDGRVHARIDDNGTWREPNPSPAGERGRGLAVLGSVADGLDISRRDDGTTVAFHRRLHRPVTTAAVGDPAGAPSSSAHRSTSPFAAWTAGTPAVLRVRGPVDAQTADELRRDLARLSRGGTVKLTVDLTEVTHLTSVGVAALAETLRAGDAGGFPATLVAPTGSPAAFVLDLVGLSRENPRGAADHDKPAGE